jgi:hypothetical protein
MRDIELVGKHRLIVPYSKSWEIDMHQEQDCKEFEIAGGHSAQVTLRRFGKANAAPQKATLVRVSQKTATVCVATPPQFEEPVALRIKDPSIGFERDFLGTVRQIRAAENGTWRVGCSVDPSLDDHMVSRLINELGLNRRRLPRERTSLGATVLRQLCAADPNAVLRNFSQAGFCVLLDSACQIEERICVALEESAPSAAMIQSRVQWQTHTPEGVFVGCRFECTDGYGKVRRAAGMDSTQEKSTMVRRRTRFPRLRWMRGGAMVLTFCLMV